MHVYDYSSYGMILQRGLYVAAAAGAAGGCMLITLMHQASELKRKAMYVLIQVVHVCVWFYMLNINVHVDALFITL